MSADREGAVAAHRRAAVSSYVTLSVRRALDAGICDRRQRDERVAKGDFSVGEDVCAQASAVRQGGGRDTGQAFEMCARLAQPVAVALDLADTEAATAWGALTRSHAATGSYSWMSPPSRSCRRIAVADPAGWPLVEGIARGSGACRSNAPCGRRSL